MTGYSQLTYTAVLLAVFANQLCLPIPSVVFLLMAGAISAHQGMHAGIVVLLSVLACLTADGLWFWFGRGWGAQAVRLLCRFSADPRQCASTAHARFGRYGLPLLCVAKFIPGLDGVMPPLVGAEGVPIPVFLAFDAVGSFFWSAFYVGVGYLLSDQLEIAIGWATHLGIAVGIAIGVPVVFYAG
jgi:membrane protein DedA with SNARE-associated domain